MTLTGRLERNAPRRPTRAELLRGAAIAFLVWAFVVLVLAEPDGFLGRTADRVDSLWLKATFLDLPLHLVLMLAVVGCAASRRPRLEVVGLALAALNVVLIVGHVVLSSVTA